MTTRYLVTGGCGFIGSHLVDHLITQGHEVCILDDLSTGKKSNIPNEADLLIGSINDPNRVEQALQDVDGVFHVAAIPSVQKSLDHWHTLHQVNSGGTVCLFDALSKLKRKIPLIYASSSCVYGDASTSPSKEDLPLSPLSPYGVDKLSGEWHAQVLWNVFQIPTISFRFFNVYGPRQDPSSPYSGVISLFSECIWEHAPLTIYGDGEQVRDFIYVGDVARVMSAAMSAPMSGSSVYNLCTGKGTTINQLADLMGKTAGVEVQKYYTPPREGVFRVSIGDPSLMKRILNLESAYTLEEGLRELKIACV